MAHARVGPPGSDSVTLATLSPTWQQAQARVFAPAGIAFASMEFTNRTGVAGDFLYLDEIHVGS